MVSPLEFPKNQRVVFSADVSRSQQKELFPWGNSRSLISRMFYWPTQFFQNIRIFVLQVSTNCSMPAPRKTNMNDFAKIWQHGNFYLLPSSDTNWIPRSWAAGQSPALVCTVELVNKKLLKSNWKFSRFQVEFLGLH